ncbi:MAG: FAD:protein FMN transferase [Calditrichaeota bacterium]|nr:MAG: FAD:protein FMN transferase [Calditrichota bacterium]
MSRLFPLFLLWMVLACSESVRPVFRGQTMGTAYSVILSDTTLSQTDAQNLKSQIDKCLLDVNASMSTYIPESEIARFNRWHKTEPFQVSANFLTVLKQARQIYDETGGAYDVTVAPLVNLWGFGSTGRRNNPPAEKDIRERLKTIGMDKLRINDTFITKQHPALQLDFSSIAKGFGVDRVAGLLREKGYRNFLVEIGGEVVTSGLREGRPWRVGIDKPDTTLGMGHELQMVLQLSNRAVATSGDYRNFFVTHDTLYSHTIDPVSGHPIINHMASATVIAPTCTRADAMATALMVLGVEKGLPWVENQKGIEAMLIIRRPGQPFEIHTTSGFSRYQAP